MWLGHHFQGQKVKRQLAGGGGILWQPPAQLVVVNDRARRANNVQNELDNFYATLLSIHRQSYVPDLMEIS